jgi:hypothetical protein
LIYSQFLLRNFRVASPELPWGIAEAVLRNILVAVLGAAMLCGCARPKPTSLPASIQSAFVNVTRASAFDASNIVLASSINSELALSTLTPPQAIAEIIERAENTTSVATLS